MRRWSILGILILTSLWLNAQEFLLLQDAIQIGLENNFDVRIAQNETRISENNFTRGNAGFFPTIVWTGGRTYTVQDVKQEFITGSENVRDGATSNVWSTAMDATWRLFDGTKMFKTYDRLREEVYSSELEEQIAIENSAMNIALSYFEVILHKNRLVALDTSILISSERMELARNRYEVGDVPKLEYLSAQVDYNSDYSNVLSQQEILQSAKHNLNHSMSRAAGTEVDVPRVINLDTTLILDELQVLSLSGNKELQHARQTGEILKIELKEIDADRLPSIDLNLGYSYSKLSSQAGFLLNNRTNGLDYGLSATWVLFDGMNQKRRKQNAKIEIENQMERIKQLELAIQKDLETNHLIYSNNIELTKLEQQNLVLALENVDFAIDRYKLGKTTFIELRESQLKVIETLGRLLDATYLAKIAEINLLKLSGSLLSE